MTLSGSDLASAKAINRLVIVNGNLDTLAEMEPDFWAFDSYDVVCLASVDHAYSHIKRVRPHLVLLYVNLNDGHGLEVLTMLKLDPETSHIPVVTYTNEEVSATETEEEEDPYENEEEALLASNLARMN